MRRIASFFWRRTPVSVGVLCQRCGANEGFVHNPQNRCSIWNPDCALIGTSSHPVKTTFQVESAHKGPHWFVAACRSGTAALANATLVVLLSGGIPVGRAATLPAGFTEEIIPGPWDGPVGLTFEPDHRTSGGRHHARRRHGRVQRSRSWQSSLPLLPRRPGSVNACR